MKANDITPVKAKERNVWAMYGFTPSRIPDGQMIYRIMMMWHRYIPKDRLLNNAAKRPARGWLLSRISQCDTSLNHATHSLPLWVGGALLKS